MLTDERIDSVIDAILGRFDHAPDDTQIDIYVWSDGRVTEPPTGDETDNDKLIAVVTPTGERPTRDELRETLRRGMQVVDTSEPPVADVENIEQRENGRRFDQVTSTPHFKEPGATPPARTGPRSDQ